MIYIFLFVLLDEKADVVTFENMLMGTYLSVVCLISIMNSMSLRGRKTPCDKFFGYQYF